MSRLDDRFMARLSDFHNKCVLLCTIVVPRIIRDIESIIGIKFNFHGSTSVSPAAPYNSPGMKRRAVAGHINWVVQNQFFRYNKQNTFNPNHQLPSTTESFQLTTATMLMPLLSQLLVSRIKDKLNEGSRAQ